MAKKFKSGFVTLIGRPNVGKSTLMNMLIGEKISIISSKPQTTRNKIQTILTTDNAQVVFIDTPGLHTAKSKLGEYMVKSAETTMNDVDLVLYLIEPFEKIKDSDKAILDRLKNVTTPVFLVINKIDTINKEELFKVISSYKEVYDDSITFNKYARKMVYDRLKWNIKQGRYPALVVCKFIAHCEKLCKYFKKKLGSKYNIACVHVDTPSKIRQQIMKDFREGKIDILVSTTIIARGKNFPKLRYLLNAASMDSQEKSIQFLGRLVRTDSSKKKVYLDDLHYPGPYLNRHGKHRKQYYQKQELKVILLEKIWKNHPIHSL